jgi:hypothetical protein
VLHKGGRVEIFLGVEREFAQRWRSELANMDFSSLDTILRSLGATVKSSLGTWPRHGHGRNRWFAEMVGVIRR